MDAHAFLRIAAWSVFAGLCGEAALRIGLATAYCFRWGC
jgi:hypothetical protein